MTEKPLTSVVVGVDDSPHSLQTAAVAATVAAGRDLPLRVVHARPWPTYSGNPPVMTYPVPPLESEPEARNIVDAACGHVRKTHPDLSVTGHAVDGGPAVVLIEESQQAALVVVGSRGEGGFAELLLGSTAQDVAARAACPVLIVRGEATTSGPVVVGVDGRPSSATAIAFAFAEAQARKVPLRAVHAWHHSTNLVDTAESEYDGRQRAQDILDESLREWREGFDDVAVEAVPVHQGNTAKVLGEESAKASLLVVGSRMRGAVRSRLLGSTGYAMIHASQCPVVIVHPRP